MLMKYEDTRVLQREHKLAKREIRETNKESPSYPHRLAFIRNVEGELKNRQVRFTPFVEES